MESGFKDANFRRYDMEKQLFAKTQAAKFFTLLAATLAMFTACNFVGGQEARKTIGGINSTYVDPKGFFKSLEGTSPQIWENTFSTNDRSAILAGSQGWWGGAWGLFNNGAAIDSYFDMQNISYATCDIKASEDIKEFYVTIAADVSSKYSANPLTSGKHEIKIPCNLTKRYVNPILTMGGACNEGATIVPSNFTFYDKDGKEIVPKIVDKKDIENKKDIFDENDTTQGLEWMPTGMMTWTANGSDKISFLKLENMGFTGLTVGCTSNPSWAGFGIGMISSDGSKIEKWIDVTKVHTVEFDVYSVQDGQFKFVFQSGKDTKDEFEVETKAFETLHKELTISDEKHKNWTNYLYLLDAINGYSTDAPIVLTNLVFKDKEGNAITNFATRLNCGSVDTDEDKIYNTSVTDLGDF